MGCSSSNTSEAPDATKPSADNSKKAKAKPAAKKKIVWKGNTKEPCTPEQSTERAPTWKEAYPGIYTMTSVGLHYFEGFGRAEPI